MKHHKYRPFTTRDGSKACAECYANEHAEQHQSLQHSEIFTQDYDRGDGVFVDAHICKFETPVDHGSSFCRCGKQRSEA